MAAFPSPAPPFSHLNLRTLMPFYSSHVCLRAPAFECCLVSPSLVALDHTDAYLSCRGLITEEILNLALEEKEAAASAAAEKELHDLI